MPIIDHIEKRVAPNSAGIVVPFAFPLETIENG